jgi:hypothetical protein
LTATRGDEANDPVWPEPRLGGEPARGGTIGLRLCDQRREIEDERGPVERVADGPLFARDGDAIKFLAPLAFAKQPLRGLAARGVQLGAAFEIPEPFLLRDIERAIDGGEHSRSDDLLSLAGRAGRI